MPDQPNPTHPEAPAAAPPPAKAPPSKPPAIMATTPWDGDLPRQLKEQFGDSISEASTYASQNFLVVKFDAVISIIKHLKHEANFDYLVDITAVDWPKRTQRFDLIYILYSFARNERIRIKTAVPVASRPESAVSVHATANWLEREVFDMFGIEFEGHPDLRRILLPEDWNGHPLRKDYPLLQQDQGWVQANLGIERGQ
ncbi:MAG TPA: NADH-quinone oxidoreductase subunit C [Bryobacteraceae bacterium]|nr:NADH-quinone oxidoreductase subunit C [Bryobacteraceae bacterium]